MREIENPQDNVPLEDVIKDGNANEINQQATMKSYLMTRTTGHPLERIHSVITGIGEVVGLAEFEEILYAHMTIITEKIGWQEILSTN